MEKNHYELQHELAGERNLNNTSGYISPIYLRYFYEFNIWYNLYAIITNFIKDSKKFLRITKSTLNLAYFYYN